MAPSVRTAIGPTHLYFHGHLPAVLHPRQVNLADGRRSKRTLLKRLQLVSPVATQVTVESFLHTDTQTEFQLKTNTVSLVIINVKINKHLLSFVWSAWNRRSVAHGQRSWRVGGWWKRRLKCRKGRLHHSQNPKLLGSYRDDGGWRCCWRLEPQF